MQKKTESIRFPDTGSTHLPLGYRGIVMKQIPLRSAENKFKKYNSKYKHLTYQAMQSPKPISKILK